MALTFNGSTDYLVCPDRAGFDSTSGTVSCRFKTASVGSGNMMRRDSVTTDRHWLLRVGAGSSDGKLQFQVVYGGNPSVISAATKNDSNWHHAAGTWNWNGVDTTTIELWCDAVSEGTNTASASDPGGFEPVWCGAFNGSPSVSDYFSGDLADGAVWNATLSSGEIAALAKGYSPLAVRRANLVLHVPLVRNVLDSLTTAPTIVGTPTAAAHSRIIMPARQWRTMVPSAAAPVPAIVGTFAEYGAPGAVIRRNPIMIAY